MGKTVPMILLIFFAAGIAPCLAHPHIFVQPVATVIIEGDKLTGVTMEWKWDTWWSRMILQHCDLDQNNRFSPEETELVYRDYFREIEKYTFLTDIRVNDKRPELDVVEGNFNVTTDRERRITFEFSLMLNTVVTDSAHILLVLYDDIRSIAFLPDIEVRAVKTAAIHNLTTGSYKGFGVRAEFDLDIGR